MMRALLFVVTAAGLMLAVPARGQTGFVTLYGRLNMDMQVVNGKQSGDGCPSACPNPSQYRVSSNASMFGLRGVEVLGDGVEIVFQLENKLFLNTGGGVLAGRESFLGVQGPLGMARAGYFLSPYDEIAPIFGNAPTLNTSILSTGALWAQAYLGAPQLGGFDDRLPNSVRYDSPVISGLNGSVQYSTAEGIPTPQSHISSFGGFYNNGPLRVGVAYELHHNIRGTPSAPLSDTALSVAAAYQFDGIRFGAVYERLRYDVTTSTDLTRNFWGIGTTIDAGPGLVYAYWGHASSGGGSAAEGSNIGGLVKGVNTDASQWEVSYTLLLSSRTLLYAGYVKILNGSNASYTFDVNPYPIVCGPYPNGNCGRPGGFLIGMVQFF